MSTAAIIEQAQPSTILRDVEESAILAVWEQGKKHNIEFGRLCYEYSEKYGAQGSAGNGLAQFLRKHSINEGVAYYWIAEFKAKNGKGIPCPDCELTFPSKKKLGKHRHQAHPAIRPEHAVENYSDINPETGRPYNAPSSHPETVEGVSTVTVNDEKDSGNYHRGHGMAMSRWRPIAESLGYKLGCDNDNFILSKDGVKTNLGCYEYGLREFLRAKQALVVPEPEVAPEVEPLDALDVPESVPASESVEPDVEVKPESVPESVPLESESVSQSVQDDFAEALALPDVVVSPTLLAPKQEYAKNERGISLLKKLAEEVSAQYNGECVVKGTSGADNLPVTTGRYNITLNLKGVSQQRITNALNALRGEG